MHATGLRILPWPACAWAGPYTSMPSRYLKTKLFVLPFSVDVLFFCQPDVRHQSMSNVFSLICCACTLSVCSPLLNVRACHLHADI